MSRLAAFRSFRDDTGQSSMYRKLKKEDIKMAEDFLIENEALDHHAFAEKANRWMLDQERPKNFSTIWGLVISANSKTNPPRRRRE